jgi:hypothetical protein
MQASLECFRGYLNLLNIGVLSLIYLQIHRYFSEYYDWEELFIPWAKHGIKLSLDV